MRSVVSTPTAKVGHERSRIGHSARIVPCSGTVSASRRPDASRLWISILFVFLWYRVEEVDKSSDSLTLATVHSVACEREDCVIGPSANIPLEKRRHSSLQEVALQCMPDARGLLVVRQVLHPVCQAVRAG